MTTKDYKQTYERAMHQERTIVKKERVYMNQNKKINMGQICMSERVDAVMRTESVFKMDVRGALAHFGNGDWGLTCKYGAVLNDRAVQTGENIVATYRTCRGRIWISTETIRDSKNTKIITTVRFPVDY